MEGVDYQHQLSVKQAENELAYGEQFGNPDAVRAAKKRIRAALEGTPSDPYVESAARAVEEDPPADHRIDG